jgi:hypothetical protein
MWMSDILIGGSRKHVDKGTGADGIRIFAHARRFHTASEASGLSVNKGIQFIATELSDTPKFLFEGGAD